MKDQIHLHTFSNGIRLSYKQITHTNISHVGIMLDIGSRDELPEQQGLAHFWEHMAFKGTEKRSAFGIIDRLENVGGDINAYTTKEKICFHASVLNNYTDRAIELLTDICFASTFPEKSIQKEKEVILEEMAMYLDSPDEAILDEFDEIVYPNHPIGRNILGTTESVSGFTREDLQQFINQNIDTERIILSITSSDKFDKIKKMAEKWLGNIPAQKVTRNRTAPTVFQAQNLTKTKQIGQAHLVMGCKAYGLNEANRIPFYILNNLLGGPAMSSRLNLSLREKNGLVYSIDSNYSPYVDTGFFGVYFGTEAKKLQKSLALVHKELENTKNKALTSSQLHKLKNQLKGQLAMAEESNMGFMQLMAKSYLDLGRVESLHEIFKLIDGITSAKLQDIANEIFDFDQFSYLTYLPEK